MTLGKLSGTWVNCGELGRKWVQICSEDRCWLLALVWRGLSGRCFLPGPRASDLHSGRVCRSQYCLSFPFSLCRPFTHTKGKISCFVYFFLCLLIPPPLESGLLWRKVNKRSPSAIHLKFQRREKKAGPSQ